MDHAATTKINDAVTNRQFNRFLATAHLPSIWKGRVEVLADVYEEIFLPEVEKGVPRLTGYIFVYSHVRPHRFNKSTIYTLYNVFRKCFFGLEISARLLDKDVDGSNPGTAIFNSIKNDMYAL